MTTAKWTLEMETAFQTMRRARGGEPLPDAAQEAAYQAEKSRRFRTPPSEEMLDAQLREERGESAPPNADAAWPI